MYPILRLCTTMLRAGRRPPLGILDTDVTTMRCWPVDIDMYIEMTNGRIMTLYDLARFSLAVRAGLFRALRKNRWGLAVAGTSVRFRRRILPFQRFDVRTRMIGWDDRFIYLEQSMWRGDDCCSNLLIRTAVTGQHRAVPTDKVIAALGITDVERPTLPAWVQAWIDAEAERPWPPDL